MADVVGRGRKFGGPVVALVLLASSWGLVGCGDGPPAPADGSVDDSGDAGRDAVADAPAGDGSVEGGRDGGFVAPRCEPDPSVDCASVEQHLPVVTHWSGGEPSWGGTDVPSVEVDDPIGDPASYSPGDCYPAYRLGIPDYEDYLCDTYNCANVPEADARRGLEALCEGMGVPVRILPPTRLEPGAPDEASPRSGSCEVQVIHAARIGETLATIILPPNWSADAPEGTYPILLNSFYDLNANVFTQHGPWMMRVAGLSGLGGRRGVIGVLTNGGGAVGSRGFDERMLRDTAALIDAVARRYGGNRYEVLTFGLSRGGYTSLAIASNPLGLDYRVALAVAVAPPTMPGLHAWLLSPTYPGLLAVAQDDLGLADAWRARWRYPACAGKPHLTGLSAAEALAYVLTGDERVGPRGSDPRNLASDRFLSGLRAGGTQLYLELTGHDVIVPYGTQLLYGATVLEAGLPAEVHLVMRNGHAPRGNAPIEVLERALLLLTEPGRAPLGRDEAPPMLVSPGLQAWAVDRDDGSYTEIDLSAGPPFTLELPYRSPAGRPFFVALTGPKDTEVQLELQPRGGRDPLSASFTLRRVVDWVQVDGTSEIASTPGVYDVTVRFRPPGAAEWTEVPRTNTPSGDPLTLEILAEEPIVSGKQAAFEVFAPPQAAYVTAGVRSNWGVSQY